MSAAPLALPSRRAFAYAAVTYLIVICALTVPRVIGLSWRSIITPMAMRNLEGLPVQWEAFLVLRSLYAMSTNDTPDDLIEWYSTDEHRATLPIYLAAIVTQLTGSYVIGITTSDVAWWWLGAIGVFLLARNFSSTSIAYCAGLLTSFSPLAVGHIGSAHLHAANSLSLSVFLVIAWRILHDDRIALIPKVVLYGSCLYLSSITYTYQWFLAPFFLAVTAVPRLSRERVIASLLGIGAFLVLRWASYGVLLLGGLEVHAHQNDPWRVILSRLSDESEPGSALMANL